MAYRDPVREALQNLLGHWDEFVSRGGFGNQEDAFYCLAKGAQQHWVEARAALAAPSAVGELTAAMRECLAMFDSHMGALYGRGHDVPLAAGVELIRLKFVALIAKYGAAK